jgi:glycosyltransferase involved in cell wall biosynthesis
MKILFLAPYPLNISPSQRFRFEQYFPVLTAAGHSYEVQTFLQGAGDVLFRKGNFFSKIWALTSGKFRRLHMLTRVHQFDRVFIHREVMPIGPPVFEWIIAVVLRKTVIYDFDDAIWLTDRLNEPLWMRIIKWRSKVGAICRWSNKVSAGNEYLRAFARNYNAHVEYNPSTVDTENVHRPTPGPTGSGSVTIGWTGSHTTLKYLALVEDVLKEMEKKYSNLKFLVIANEPPSIGLKSMEFIPWRRETEISDLRRIDIGIMPLPDDEWSKGKCGFKLLQYLALEKPAVASPVGVNVNIIIDGENGYLAKDKGEWMSRLSDLIESESLRKRMGTNGRAFVTSRYSVASNSSNFLSLLE